MKNRIQIIIMAFMVVVFTLSGCTKTKEIKVSDDVKSEALAKVDDNKLKNKPILKKKLSGLDDKRILCWIDNENILVASEHASGLDKDKVVLYSYNLESEESTEILNDSNITRIYSYWFDSRDGVILLGNEKQAFIYDAKERKLEEALDLDKEFKDGVPGAKKPKEKQDLRWFNVQLINKNYISYVSDLSKEKSDDTAEYTILNLKENKKYTLDERYSAAGIDCKFDLTGKNIYIGQFSKLSKLNIETGNISSMELSMPRIPNVFEDGTLFAYCTEENGTLYDKGRLYRVDFDNKKVTRYDENYGGKNISIEGIDFKNEFVIYTYLGDGDDREQNVSMYGKMEGNRFIVTDKLFKNDEEKDSNDPKEFIFSPNHNKFITRVAESKIETKENEVIGINYLKDDKYLFELE